MKSDTLVSSQAQLSVTQGALSLYQSCPLDYDRQLLEECHYASPIRAAQLLTKQLVSTRFDAPWLDLGAGTGLLGRALIDAGLPLPLIAVDISRSMLARIEREPYVACAVLDALDETALAGLPAQGAIALGLSEHVLDLNLLFKACAATLPQAAPLIFSYCPLPEDTASDHEIFESFSGLIAHHSGHVAQALEANHFAWLDQQDGPGYSSGGQNVVHRIVIAARR